MDVVLTIDLRCFLGFPSSYSSSSKSWTERGFLCYLCGLGTHDHLSPNNISSINLLLCLADLQHLLHFSAVTMAEGNGIELGQQRAGNTSSEEQNSPSSRKQQGFSQSHISVGASQYPPRQEGKWCQSLKTSKIQTQKHSHFCTGSSLSGSILQEVLKTEIWLTFHQLLSYSWGPCQALWTQSALQK